MYHYFILALISIFFFGQIVFAQYGGGIGYMPPVLWKTDGTALYPTNAAWTLGTSENRIKGIYATDTDIAYLTVSASVVEGDLRVSPGDILTGEHSTTTIKGDGATSTFAGPISHVSGDFIVARGGTGNLYLNPYGGKISVGTITPPPVTLSIDGNVVISSPEYIGGWGDIIFRIGDNINDEIAIRSGSGDDIIFYTHAGAERMRITWDGKIGINTATPAKELDVAGRIRTDYAASATNLNLFIQNSDTAWATGIYNPGGRVLGFVTNDKERMRILSAGEVGIATTSPLSLLTVHASSTNPAVFIRQANEINTGPNLRLTRGDEILMEFYGSTVTEGKIRLNYNGGVTYYSILDYDTWILYGMSDFHFLHTAFANIRFSTNNTERMRITADGRVLIATTTAPSELTVQSPATTTFEVYSSDTGRGGCLEIKDSDGVGVTACYANNGVLSCRAGPCE